MLFVAPSLLGWWLRGVRHLMDEDASVQRRPRWRDWLRAARQYRVPGPWMLIVTTPARYLRPGHHPLQEASTDMALRYLARSPAARRARELAADAGAGGSP
jgi:predicted metal-dependent hydrolase